MTARFSFLLFLLLSSLKLAEGKPVLSTDSIPGSITIPIGGNTFLTNTGANDKVTSSGIKEWKSPESVLATYVHLTNSQKILLQLQLGEQSDNAEIEITVGAQVNAIVIPEGKAKTITVGSVDLAAGYNRINLKGINRGQGDFADIQAILIDPLNGDFVANFVQDNLDNRYYWGRRGPSVHLSYEIPDDGDYEWFYSL